MVEVQLDEAYAAILEPFQASVEEAVRSYALEKAQARLWELEQNVQRWEEKYGCSYDLFSYRTATDAEYVMELETNPATQEWEGDSIAWEFDQEVLREWRQRLQKLLSV
ncbi:MAG: hypothetical protein ACLFTI_03980 [Anaerolineales bacterium]